MREDVFKVIVERPRRRATKRVPFLGFRAAVGAIVPRHN